MDYPEVVDYAPLHIDAQALRKLIAKYGDDPALEKVAFAIAGYANPRGIAFPGLATLSRITGLDWKIVSAKAHLLQSAGALAIRRVKSKGAENYHNVYTFVKKIVRKSADVTSAHFIANVEKWRAEAKDVAAAVIDHAHAAAKKALDSLTEKAEKMAQLFQARPELLDAPEQAAQLSGVAETSETVEIPAVSQPTEWESFGDAAPVAWEDGAQAGPTVGSASPAVQVQTLQAAPPEPSRVFASWRDRVAAYRKETAAACRRVASGTVAML